MDAGVHVVADERGRYVRRDPVTGTSSPIVDANANADAAWPDGKDDEVGGPRASARPGRRAPAAGAGAPPT